MAATIVVVCPSCKKTIRAPDTIAGKKIKCKACQHEFVATAAMEIPAGVGDAKAPAKPQDEEWGVIKAYGVTIEKEKPRCPHCAWELEFEDDVICLHCGYNLITRMRMHQRVLEAHTGADYFAWWCPPILCVLLALAMFGAIVFIWWWWALDWGNPWTEATKVYLTVMALGVSYFALKFALRRMIFNPQPPEREKELEKDDIQQEGEEKKIRRRRDDPDDDDDDYEDDDEDEEEDDE